MGINNPLVQGPGPGVQSFLMPVMEYRWADLPRIPIPNHTMWTGVGPTQGASGMYPHRPAMVALPLPSNVTGMGPVNASASLLQG
jgi:hypothetical protein